MSDISRCMGCGAPVRIQLLNPIRCLYCGGAPALSPDQTARIAQLRHQIQQSSAKAQQLQKQVADFADGIGGFELMAAFLTWGMLGGMMIWGAAGLLEEEQSFFGVLVDPPQVGGLEFSSVVFWCTYVCVFGVGLCIFFTGLARLSARRKVRYAFPSPPLYSGGPPGCRVCGADLPMQGGLVRRCQYCQSDHVVDGVHFQRIGSSISAELSARQQAVSVTLERHQKMIQRLTKLIIGPPFLLLFTLPLVFFLGVPHVLYWVVPCMVYLLAFLLFGITWLLPNPNRTELKRMQASPRASA